MRTESVAVNGPGVLVTFNVPYCSVHKGGVWSGGAELCFISSEYAAEFRTANHIPGR